MSVTPAIVSFRRMIADQDLDGSAVDGVPNRELLHAVAALYDQSLPDVTRDIIYAHLCKSSSRSVLFIRDTQGAIKDASEKSSKKATVAPEDGQDVGAAAEEDVRVKDGVMNGEKDEGEEEEKEESSDDNHSLFDDVFSDTDAEDSEEEEESENEDFSAGSEDFVREVKRRRTLRQKGIFTTSSIGIESRLAAAASFERLVGRDEDGILQLSLISVRKRFRKRGLGKRLINMIKDPTVVGSFKCTVAYVDHGAVDFFKKHNFTDDVVISSRFKHLAENWENSTFMCYLPPYSELGPGPQLTSQIHQDALVLFQLDADIGEWKKSSIEVHQRQAVFVERLRHELLRLSAKTRHQDDIIVVLNEKVEKVTEEKKRIEQEFENFRIQSKISYQTAAVAMAERFLDLKLPDESETDNQKS